MTIEQRDKYAYELMVKNNPEEVVKQLLLKDKTINAVNKLNQQNLEKRQLLQRRINKAIEQLKTANVDIDSVRLCEIIQYAEFILKGEENERNN